MALLVAWSAEQAPAERFGAARDCLASQFPRWRLGRSYSGWVQALAPWDSALRPAIARRLRRQVQGRAGRHQARAGWRAFAADGSRLGCPRTAANQAGLGCAGKERTAPPLFLTALSSWGRAPCR